MPAPDWIPELVTARDVVSRRDVSALIHCRACNAIKAVDMWKVGSRLADTPLQRLRWRCGCGLYASEMRLRRQEVGHFHDLLTLTLHPSAWDESHDKAQQAALRRAGLV